MNLKKILKVTIPISVIAFLVLTVAKDRETVSLQLNSANPFFILCSVAVLVLTFLGGAFFWQIILGSLNYNLTFKRSLKIFIVSNFGRFIPGVFLHYIARVYMAKKAGIGVASSAVSVLLEAYYTFCGAAIISIFGMTFIIDWLKLPGVYIYIYLLFLILIISLNPKFVFKTSKKIPILKSKVTSLNFDINYTAHLKLLLLSSFLFFLNGLAFYLLSLAFKNGVFSLLELSGIFSASWIIGFLTPVAPGGLGVSDLSFAYLLSSRYEFAIGTMLVLLYRAGLIVSELLVFLAVLWMSKLDILDIKAKS